MFTLLMVRQDAGLTATEVVQNIPHDGPAFVVYAMLIAFIVLIWRGSRHHTG
ncbi:hypothetical protein BH23GEM9_BH23GEM9_00950 [soil metagenome]